jgi:16S rRNA (guanine966-N2)-methyltransferase
LNVRVIGGIYRSRRLKSLPGMDVRPTPDRLRETLFDILAPHIEGALFVDAYAGTGAVGIEALSRGARKAVFIERSRGALKVLHENLTSLDIRDEAEVVAQKASTVIAGYGEADMVFLDPPYDLEREYFSCLRELSGAARPLVIVQHASRFDLSGTWGELKRHRIVKQGDNTLSFFRCNSSGL